MPAGAALALCVGGLLVFAMLPAAVCYRALPARDSGGALYAGWRILEGDLLYRDVWDHKPPAIYFLDALGLLLGGGSAWGVVGIEFLFLFSAALLGYALLRGAFGAMPALFATAAWILTLPLVHDGGNLPEEYALPLQFLALYLFARRGAANGFSPGGVLAGAAGGLAFCLRPNLAGTWCAILICTAWRGFSSRPRRACRGAVAALLAGFAGCLLPFAAYFAARGALPDALGAVFEYNRAYAGATMRDRFSALAAGWRLMRVSGLSLTALLGVACGCAFLWRGGGGKGMRGALVQCAVIAFPVEVASACVSGRGYHHYFMAWLPVFAVLSGLFAYAVLRGASPGSAGRAGNGAFRLRALALLALLAVMAGGPAGTLCREIALFGRSPDAEAKRTAVEYLRARTRPDETVLVWGAEPSVNFLSGRRSPSRYSFQYPLYTRGYRGAQAVRTFLDDLSAREPAVIIDTSATNTLVPPLDPAKRRGWRPDSDAYRAPAALEGVFDFVSARYRREDGAGVLRWAVYRRTRR